MQANIKKTMIALVAALAALFATAGLAQQGSGKLAGSALANGRSYSVSAFQRISTIGPQRVEIAVGPAASVRAEGPEELLDKLEVTVEGGALKIQPKREYRREFHWSGDEMATFHVTLPRLTAASLAGSGNMKVDRVKDEEFAASVAGSGTLEIGALTVGELSLSIAGSGDLVIRGTAGHSSVSIAGSGDVKARRLESATAAISIAGVRRCCADGK